MIELVHPWMLALLPLPLLVWLALPAAKKEAGAALRLPFHRHFETLGGHPAAAMRRRGWIVALKVLAWSALVLAAARPVWLGDAQPVTTRGRDLMLALDLSGSMETPDFEVRGQAVDRLTVVREVAKQFVAQRAGDRLGLVLFGSRAYLQAPITRDRATLARMLDEAELGLAGEETAIGDAIGLAVKHLRERPAEERVLVLLSDGESNAGVLDPLDAAEIAASAGIRIYTIGIGSGMQRVRTPFGVQLVPGNGGLDEGTLGEIAARTGGLYFRARDTSGLVAAHQQIDALERTEGEAATVRPTRELFYWPLGAAMTVLALMTGAALLRDFATGRRRFSIEAAEIGDVDARSLDDFLAEPPTRAVAHHTDEPTAADTTHPATHPTTQGVAKPDERSAA